MTMTSKRTALVALAVAMAVSSGCGSAVSNAGSPDVASVRGDGVEMWVTSEGESLPVFRSEGRHYLLGAQGRPYEIWIANNTDGRVEVVVSVDGRDVISGREADFREDRGYVMNPGEELQVEGFRKSLSAVARFEFSSVEESYASRMGDGTNVGVIGVAVFEERERGGRPGPAPIAADRKRSRGDYGERPRAAPATGAAQSAALEMEEDGAPGLGTRYGGEVGSDAEIVPFKRLDEEDPAEVLVLYYDDREGLEAIGIEIPEEDLPTGDICDGPNPFPGVECDDRFAPPPGPLKAD